jgi:hypothetical protein
METHETQEGIETMLANEAARAIARMLIDAGCTPDEIRAWLNLEARPCVN